MSRPRCPVCRRDYDQTGGYHRPTTDSAGRQVYRYQPVDYQPICSCRSPVSETEEARYESLLRNQLENMEMFKWEIHSRSKYYDYLRILTGREPLNMSDKEAIHWLKKRLRKRGV